MFVWLAPRLRFMYPHLRIEEQTASGLWRCLNVKSNALHPRRESGAALSHAAPPRATEEPTT